MYSKRQLRSTKHWLMPIVFCALSSPAVAEIYKWVDEHGQTHYGEKPPEHRKSKQVYIRPAPVSVPSQEATTTKPHDNSSRLERQKKLIRSMSEERRQKKQQKQREEKMQKARQRNCAIAKDRLRRYQNSSAVYRVDDKGNRVFLPNSEREKSIERSRAEVKKWCG